MFDMSRTTYYRYFKEAKLHILNYYGLIILQREKT